MLFEGSFLVAQEDILNKMKQCIETCKPFKENLYCIFPILYGCAFNNSYKVPFLSDINEAQEYLQHPILGKNIRGIAELLCDASITDIKKVFPYPGQYQLHACFTLFAEISDELLFLNVLSRLFAGEKHQETMNMIKWPINRKDDFLFSDKVVKLFE